MLWDINLPYRIPPMKIGPAFGELVDCCVNFYVTFLWYELCAYFIYFSQSDHDATMKWAVIMLGCIYRSLCRGLGVGWYTGNWSGNGYCGHKYEKEESVIVKRDLLICAQRLHR